jgi:hypothetical protein
MTEQDFMLQFPGVTFVEGPPRSTDEKGRAYKTHTMCGTREFPELTPSMINVTAQQALEAFVDGFRRQLGDSKFVVVRRWPTLDSTNKIVIDESDAYPRLSYLPVYKVTARFSIYKDEGEFNDANV